MSATKYHVFKHDNDNRWVLDDTVEARNHEHAIKLVAQSGGEYAAVAVGHWGQATVTVQTRTVTEVSVESDREIKTRNRRTKAEIEEEKRRLEAEADELEPVPA